MKYSSYNEVKHNDKLPDWFKNFLNRVGEKFSDKTLIGMSKEGKDYYFIFRDAEGKEIYENCNIK